MLDIMSSMMYNNYLSIIFTGFIIGFTVNQYYNNQYLPNIIERLELVETKKLFLEGDIDKINLKIFTIEGSIKELKEKQESMMIMKKKKRNRIEVQYDDVDFGIHTPQ
jgi:hypothetical protein